MKRKTYCPFIDECPVDSLCAGSITAYSLYGPLFLSQLKVLPVPSQPRQHRSRNRHVPACPCCRIPCRPLQSTSHIILFRVVIRIRIPARSTDLPRWIYQEQRWVALGCNALRVRLCWLWNEFAMYLSAVTTCAKNFGTRQA